MTSDPVTYVCDVCGKLELECRCAWRSEPSLRSPGCSVCEWTGRHVGSIFPGPCPHCSKPTTTPRLCDWCGRLLRYPPDEPSTRCPDCEREPDQREALLPEEEWRDV